MSDKEAYYFNGVKYLSENDFYLAVKQFRESPISITSIEIHGRTFIEELKLNLLRSHPHQFPNYKLQEILSDALIFIMESLRKEREV